MRFNPKAFQTAQDNAAAVAAAPVVAAVSTTERTFILAYGMPAASRVPIPERITAVTISMRHNDSAGQVDYYDPHASLGCPEFLLLLASAASATEKLARRALGLAPSLHSLDWTWHTERHSGGHGNYLQSSPFPLPPSLEIHRHRTMGGAITTVFWEIEFNRSRRAELWPHRCFGARPLDKSPLDAPIGSRASLTATFKVNAELHGVEIHFSHRPPDAALAPIREQRWRYNGHTKCWYTKQYPASLAFAARFVASFNEPNYEDQNPQVLPIGGEHHATVETASGPEIQAQPHSNEPAILPAGAAPAPPRAGRPVRQIIRFTDV